MKKTALSQKHEEMGAKMVPFAGFYMPVQFEGLIAEHLTVREKVGVFDVSHMGEFWAKGDKAFDFAQKITTNDVGKLGDGDVQYTCMPNGRGGIVDDLLVYRINQQTFLLVVNAANIDKDWDWCAKQAEAMGIKVGKELYNASDEISQLAVQGPLALKAMDKITSEPVSDMKMFTFKKLEIAGVKDVIFSTTGYTGESGCEIYMANKDAAKIYDAVLEAGKEFGIKPIGLGARDTLRMEKGFCLYGNDIDDTTSPIEAGLGWITKFVDGNDFIDRELLAKQKEEGVSKRLKGFVMQEKGGIPRQDCEVVDADGNNIGKVTSGTMSPSMKQGIGMAYLKKGYTKADTEIYIKIRKKTLKAKVVKLPIFKG